MCLFLILLSCSGDHTSNDNLPFDFYKLNKDKNFDELFNVIISTRSMKATLNPKPLSASYYKISYFDSLINDYILFPIVKYPFNKSAITFSFERCDEKCKEFLRRKYNLNTNNEILSKYIELIGRIINEYHQIGVPEYYAYKAVFQVSGNPKLGSFIQFKLNEKTICFYLKNNPTIKHKYWKEMFSSIKKIDDNWYYSLSTE